jgi:hypothetical protein
LWIDPRLRGDDKFLKSIAVVLKRAGKPVRAFTGPKISAKASRQRKKTRFLCPNGSG